MKILLYNWVPFDDSSRRGGGVTLYLHDLIQKMCEDSEIECFFLSSGLEYDFGKTLRIEQTQNKFSEKVYSFQIVNSPVTAPACMQFADLNTYLTDTTLLALLENFWVQQSGFDVVHFHNLEGLSLPVLKLKELHPETKFFFSLHNYFLFCPQVNLWTNTEKNCFRESCYPNCTQCIIAPNPKIERIASSAKAFLRRLGNLENTNFYHFLKWGAKHIRRHSVHKKNAEMSCSETDAQDLFMEYRTKNVEYANRYFDKIFAVSQQVADIALTYGIRSKKVCTEYIGTTAASLSYPQKKHCNNILTLGYLGYARVDKGFDLLLKALNMLPDSTTKKTDVILAAKCETKEAYLEYSNKIRPLTDRFHSFSFQNGYTKSEQAELLSKLSLGIVPVQWEDNLPQVAIEYVAHGIPILSSDYGGTKELCTNDDFVFNGSSVASLVEKLIDFVEYPEKLDTFWTSAPQLITMNEHILKLKHHYNQNFVSQFD